MTYPELLFDCAGMTDEGTFLLDATGRGADRAPDFVLHNLSPQVKTLAITLEDLTHPIKGFTHWVIWDIPAASRIQGGIPAGGRVPGLGAVQGVGYGLHRYAGPKPPKGKTHCYQFTLYGLDCVLGLGPWATKRAFLRRAEGHILQKGAVKGSFKS